MVEDDDDAGIMVGAPVPEAPEPPRKRARRKGRAELVPWSDSVDGLLVKFEIYEPTVGPSYPNWIMKCPNPAHVDCEKSKKVCEAHSRAHGKIECLAFLHEWMALPPRPGTAETHPWRINPSKERVAACAAAHQAELEAVCDRYGL